MRLNITKIEQTASGGSHVVIHESDIEFRETPIITVDILNVDPEDTTLEPVELARSAIPKVRITFWGQWAAGASIIVGRLVVDEIDFKPFRFSMFTAHEIEVLLARAPWLRVAPNNSFESKPLRGSPDSGVRRQEKVHWHSWIC